MHDVCFFADVFSSLPRCTCFLPSLPFLVWTVALSATFIIPLSARCQDCGGSRSPLTYPSILHLHKCTHTCPHTHTHTHSHSVTTLSDSRRHHFIWQEEGCRTGELGLFSWREGRWGGGLTFFRLSLPPYPPPPARPEVRPDSPGTCLTWRWGQGVISSHKEDPASLGNQHQPRKQECQMRDFPLLERITHSEGVRASLSLLFLLFSISPDSVIKP